MPLNSYLWSAMKSKFAYKVWYRVFLLDKILLHQGCYRIQNILMDKEINIRGCTLYKQGFLDVVHGHGRMMDPPSRNAMWRFGYPNPVNYNDNEVFCGGFGVQARIYAAVNSCDTVPTGYSKTVLQLDCHIIQ